MESARAIDARLTDSELGISDGSATDQLHALSIIMAKVERQDAEIERLSSSRLTALQGALEEITAACEADCGGSITDDCSDDEPVGWGDEHPMALTFGMMRRARALLSAVLASPQRQDTK
jgi:hypothetical protein